MTCMTVVLSRCSVIDRPNRTFAQQPGLFVIFPRMRNIGARHLVPHDNRISGHKILILGLWAIHPQHTLTHNALSIESRITLFPSAPHLNINLCMCVVVHLYAPPFRYSMNLISQVKNKKFSQPHPSILGLFFPTSNLSPPHPDHSYLSLPPCLRHQQRTPVTSTREGCVCLSARYEKVPRNVWVVSSSEPRWAFFFFRALKF
jgi:hypothetical protein